MSAVSTFEVEARSYELDAYGHVNQATHVLWFEHGRLVFLRERGMTYTSIPDVYGVHVMVLRQDVTYRGQIHLGDQLRMTSQITRFGRTSFTWSQTLHRADADDDAAPVTVAEVTMVCVGADSAAAPMPDELRGRLEG